VEVIKAMRFYQLAGDVDRSIALLDRALWRCCSAVVNASDALRTSPSSSLENEGLLYLLPKGLQMNLVKPRGPVVRGDDSLADFWDLRYYIEAVSGGLCHDGVSNLVTLGKRPQH
jgi:hypothetical protein